MRCWWMDNREAPVKDLAQQAQSLLYLQGCQRGAATRENRQWTEVVRCNTKDPNRSGKLLRVMAIDDTGTPSTSEKEAHSLEHTWAQVVSPIASASSSSADDSDLTFMVTGTYCRFWYSSNHVTSECRHLKQETQFVWARNSNYEAKFGENGNTRKQIQHPVSRLSPPPKGNPAPRGKFNNNINQK